MTNMTQEEKIDAIYEMLKKSEKRARMHTFFKVLFWITMFAYSYYVMVYTLPNLIRNFMPSMPGSGNESSLNMSDILANPEIKKLYESYLQK